MGNGINGNWSSTSTVSATGNSHVDPLLSGYQWSTDGSKKTIYYSFPGSTPTYASGYSGVMEWQNGYKALNSTQQAAVTAALATWEAVANVDFVLTTESSTQAGDIRFAMWANPNTGSLAYAYYPSGSASGGDVWLNKKYFNGDNISVGSYNFMGVIHEIGHAIGLKHPGNYNAGGGGTSGPYLSTAEDKYAYSIMSYNHGSDFDSSINLTGPSIYDIETVQRLYGANTSAGAGDNSYVLKDTAFTTIWDPNGTNTIDASSVTGSHVVDLREGKFSYVGSDAGLAVAVGTKISAAKTGTGVATVYCNNLGDTVTLSGSANTVFGGTGSDTVVMAGKASDYSVSTSGTTTTLTSSKGKTTLTDVENVRYADGSETETGEGEGVTLMPDYVNDYGDTGVYKLALSALGLKSISSITITDDNFISGGTAGASGLDLDFIKISSTDTSSVSSIRGLRDAGGFNFSSSAVQFSAGFMTKWDSSTDPSSWNTSTLFGVKSDGSLDFTNATLGTLDGSNGSGYGSVSLGEGGKITFTFSTAIDPTGKYLYFGDVGGSNDGCYVTAGSSSSAGVSSSSAGLKLYGTDGDDDLRLGVGSNAGLGAGNDVIQGGAGNDRIDGGAGFNTAVFTGARSAYSITRSGSALTVSGIDGTDTLTNIQRLRFDDREVAGALPSFQNSNSSLSGSAGGTSLTITQAAIDDTDDDTRGTLSSKVQVNGADVTGVPATLKKGWKVGTTLDVTGSGSLQLFFFGVDSVSGVGSGYGATWTLNSSGAVTASKVQIQMKKQGWEVAGAGDVNGRTGDEVIWQNTVTGDKAIWTDTDRDGTMDGGFLLSALGQKTAERIVGYGDLDKDGSKEFMLYNDESGKLSLYEATASASTLGSVDLALQRTFDGYSAFQTAATAAGASYTVFPFIA